MTEHQIFIPTPRDPKGRLAWLSMNERTHWAPKASKVKQWRTLAKITAQNEHLPKGLQRVHVTCTVHKTNNRVYDVHNLTPTAKAIIDGLVDYGLLDDDSNAYLVGPDMRPGEKQDQAGVTVTIRPPSMYDVIGDE